MTWHGPYSDYIPTEFPEYHGVTHIFEKGKALCNQPGAWVDGYRKCKKCIRILRRREGLLVTVGELFTADGVTLEMLDERSEDSEYWLSCRNFITQKWADVIEGMTSKQTSWAEKILEDMVKWRAKNN